MFKRWLILGSSLLIFILSSGCMTAAQHQENLLSTKEREMTLGIVQKEIRVGMSQADVVAALGSPNIITRDSEGKETWVYDKIATEVSYSQDKGSIGGGVGAGSSSIVGLLVGGYSNESGAVSKSQKTLTVIIKFDKNNKVESFSYHISKF